MTISAYQSTVPAFIDMLSNMKNWLDKAATQKPEAVLMEARLAPDMFPLPKQFQIVSDIAKNAITHLSGTEAPAMPDTESTFAELKDRCDRTIAFLNMVEPATLDGGLDREVTINFPDGAGLRFNGLTYLIGFALPNFYFHASTAYDILRNQDVELGKADFLTHLGPHLFGMPQAAEA